MREFFSLPLMEFGFQPGRILVSQSARVQSQLRDLSNFFPSGLKPANPKRRKRAERNVANFVYAYGPELQEGGEAHEETLDALERTINGDINDTMFWLPRGFGKTTMARLAVIKAVLTGRRKGVVLVHDTDANAANSLHKLAKMFVTPGTDLAMDYPEAFCAFVHGGLTGARYNTQNWKGHRIHAAIKKNSIVFPVIPGSPCSGAFICCASLASFSRGINEMVPPDPGSGKRKFTVARVDLVVVDDPQKDAHADSVAITDDREQAFVAGIGGSGSHVDGRAANIVIATPIKQGDIVTRLADKKLHPEFTVVKYPFLKRLPDREDLWMGEYTALYRSGPDGPEQATDFYIANREEMDRGAEPSWKHCFQTDELSAVQHFYNLRIRHGERFIQSEMQMTPFDPENDGTVERIQPAQMRSLQKTGDDTSFRRVACYIDMQQDWLYWMLVGGTGETYGIVDFGRFPDFAPVNRSLRSLERGGGMRRASGLVEDGDVWRWGLGRLYDWLLGSTIAGAGPKYGTVNLAPPEVIGADASGNSIVSVYDFVSEFSGSVKFIPCIGKTVPLGMKQMNEWGKPNRAKKERAGDGWRWESTTHVSHAKGRMCLKIDTRIAKNEGFDAVRGGRVTVSPALDAVRLDALEAAFQSEQRFVTTQKGLSLYNWEVKHDENHLWDCFVNDIMLLRFEGDASQPGRPRAKRPAGVPSTAPASAPAPRPAGPSRPPSPGVPFRPASNVDFWRSRR